MESKLFQTLISLTLVSLISGLPYYYHTTDQINKIYKRSCGRYQDNSADIPAVIIDSNTNVPKQKVFILCGEHARELISGELGVNLLNQICNQLENDVQHYQYFLVGNANPTGRVLAEQGSYCKRTNGQGVDLNRNYDSHWEVLDDCHEGTPCYPGPTPFSEMESRQIRDWMIQFKPDFFVSIHSGKLDLGMPYAYNKESAELNAENMLQVLKCINDTYQINNCDVGPIGRDLGYLAPGTSMDYAYDNLKIEYTFTLEI